MPLLIMKRTMSLLVIMINYFRSGIPFTIFNKKDTKSKEVFVANVPFQNNKGNICEEYPILVSFDIKFIR